MQLFKLSMIFLLILCLFSCSASYKELSKNSKVPTDEFSKYLLNDYKEKADFEAKVMHDWNSAKLYSEKALKAIKGEKIYPQKITYWQIPVNKKKQLIKSYNNLLIIYEDAIVLDPFNLSKAISSLDCWFEQQEENWQTWDINKCRDDYLKAMHSIYKIIKTNELKLDQSSKKNEKLQKKLNNNKKIVKVVYFDFDKYEVSEVALDKIKYFIKENNNLIDKFLVVGHTDTVGTKNYNKKLSLQRARAIKNILVDMGFKYNNIKILGKGESDLSIKTIDEVPHPVNRRAEISLLN